MLRILKSDWRNQLLAASNLWWQPLTSVDDPLHNSSGLLLILTVQRFGQHLVEFDVLLGHWCGDLYSNKEEKSVPWALLKRYWISIAANPDSCMCPMWWLCLQLHRLPWRNMELSFMHAQNGATMVKSQIHYSTLRAMFLRTLVCIGLYSPFFDTHSLLMGRATIDANIATELSIPDHL